MDRAFKTALTPPKAHGSVFSSVGWSEPRVLPDEAGVIEAAELLGAGVAKALLGREASANLIQGCDHPPPAARGGLRPA
nr:hypothetical protein [Streptomyces sp. NRRL F-5126]